MTAQRLVYEKQQRLVVRVCNYSDEPYELRKDSFLTRAEPVECLPGPGEELYVSRKGNMLSVSTGVSGQTDLLPTAGRDPVAIPSATTASASTMAVGADTPVAEVMR